MVFLVRAALLRYKRRGYTTMQAVVLSDADLNILWANERLQKLLNRPLEELRGTSFLLFMQEPEHGDLREALEKAAVEFTRVEHAVTFYVGKDKKPRRILFVIDPIKDEETGKIAYRIAQGERIRMPPQRSKADSDAMQRTYRFSNLTLAEGQRLFERLNHEVTVNKLYLDKAFGIEHAAKLLHTNTTYVSQVINFFTDHTFPYYVNMKRISYLLNYVRNHPQESKTEIWRKAGFGSYHAFYRFVKQSFGKTPKALFAEAIAKSEAIEEMILPV